MGYPHLSLHLPKPGLLGISRDVQPVPTSLRTSWDDLGCPSHRDHQGPKSHMSPPYPGMSQNVPPRSQVPNVLQDFLGCLRMSHISPSYPELPGKFQDVHHIAGPKSQMSPPRMSISDFLACRRVSTLVGHSVIHSWPTQCIWQTTLAYIHLCMCATSVTLRNAIESQVTFRIRVITMSVTELFGPRGQPCVQDSILTSYMDAAFVLLAHEGSEIWTNQSLLFTQVGLLQIQSD